MKVLNKGEVILVDHMAGDHKVYGAARVSTGKRPEDSSSGEVADRHLIEYLMKNGHGTPFEHAVFQFFVKAPIFVVREWQRHRIASYNEQSGRYKQFEPEFYIPQQVRVPDPRNKQSSVPVMNDFDNILHRLNVDSQEAFDSYEWMIGRGVAREIARLILPLNMYTSFWFTVNARSLMNFLELRTAENAQWEIQEYARAMEDMFREIMPMTHDAWHANGRKAP
jgi:thymidylate synthase (FAD)